MIVAATEGHIITKNLMEAAAVDYGFESVTSEGKGRVIKQKGVTYRGSVTVLAVAVVKLQVRPYQNTSIGQEALMFEHVHSDN